MRWNTSPNANSGYAAFGIGTIALVAFAGRKNFKEQQSRLFESGYAMQVDAGPRFVIRRATLRSDWKALGSAING